jgi:hypothetical protein
MEILYFKIIQKSHIQPQKNNQKKLSRWQIIRCQIITDIGKPRVETRGRLGKKQPIPMYESL